MHYSFWASLARMQYPQDAGLPGACLCWNQGARLTQPLRRRQHVADRHTGRLPRGTSSLQSCVPPVPDSSPECLAYIKHNPRSSGNEDGKEKSQSLGRSFSSSRTAPTAIPGPSGPGSIPCSIFLRKMLITYGLPALYLGQRESKILSRVLYIYSSRFWQKEIQS